MKPRTTAFGTALRAIEWSLWTVGFACLGVVVGAWAEAETFQTSRQESFAIAVERSAGGRPEASSPVAVTPPSLEQPWRLEIPRLGHTVMVGEGVDEETLRRGPGHFPETAVPGSTGNVAIAGHRDVDFRPLRQVKEGEEIVLATPVERFRYRVESLDVVGPTAVEILDPTAEPTLTLMTCHPFDYVGPAPERYVVRARLLE